MSVGGDDSGSPWLRDDWSAPPSHAFVDDVDPRPPGVGKDPISPRWTSSRAARIGIAACVAAVIVTVVVMVSTRDESVPAATDETSEPEASDRSDETVTIAPGADRSTAPLPTEVDGADAAAAVAGAAEADVTTTGIGGFVVGEIPTWSESTIDIPSPLAEMTVPTEVVVKSNGKIRRIDIPSGRVRSLDAGELGLDFQVVVGRTAIVAHNARDLVILRDDLPTVVTTIAEGVSVVGPRPGRDDFIVVIPGDESQFGERELILDVDGSLRDAPAAFSELPFWATFFLPSGDLVVDRPGGVYSIGDDGAAARIDDGELLAVGLHHYAVERCSPTLDCAVAVVDPVSGATVIVDDAIADVITSDVGTRLSPDGGSALYIGYGEDVPKRRVVDMASAGGVSVGGVDQLVWGDSWAADSSGVFTEVSGVLQFTDRVTGAVTELGREWAAESGGGGSSSVAVRPAP